VVRLPHALHAVLGVAVVLGGLGDGGADLAEDLVQLLLALVPLLLGLVPEVPRLTFVGVAEGGEAGLEVVQFLGHLVEGAGDLATGRLDGGEAYLDLTDWHLFFLPMTY